MRVALATWIDRKLPWLVLLLAALMAAQYLYLVHREQAQSACQAKWNESFSKTLIIRSRIGQDSDEAKSAVIGGVGKMVLAPAPKTKAEAAREYAHYRQLFLDFNKADAAIRKARAENQLPPFPNC